MAGVAAASHVAPVMAQATQPAATQPAGTATPVPAERKPFDLRTSPTLTGDWGGARTSLKDAGFSLAPMLYSGYQQNYRGGLNTENAHDLPGLVQYNFELDFAKMKLIPGGSFFIRGLQSWNDGIRDDVGSLSQPAMTWGSSDDNEILVDKWWWRQRFLDDRVEIRLGKLLNIIDLFDVNAFAGSQYTQFANSALVTNPTIPTTKGIGAFARVWPTDWMYFAAAAIDPDANQRTSGFDTAFHGQDYFRGFWELGLTPKWNTARGPLPGNYRVGWWYEPRPKLVFDDDPRNRRPNEYETGDVGFYANFDQLVWKEQANAKDKQGLGLFGRYGFAHGDLNRIHQFWSTGMHYEGLLPTRDRDLCGFGVAQSVMSEQYRERVRRTASQETVFELYYAIEIAPWLVITPDIQFIMDPGGDTSTRDSLIGGIRIKMAL